MPLPRKLLTGLPALLFGAMLLGGLAVSLVSLQAVSKAEWLALADREQILNGKSTHAFTKLLNQNFVLAGSFSSIEHGVLWNLSGDLGDRVRAGCGDWLFLTDELQVYAERQQAAAFRAALAAQLQRQLKARGIRLLLVTVPDKSRIEAAHLCGIRRAAVLDDRLVRWLVQLNEAGVVAQDLTGTLQALLGERYYRTDTHWNESGAGAAATAIANHLRELQWVSGEVLAVSAPSQQLARSGDLVRLAGLDGLPLWLRPGLEQVQSTAVEPVAVASDDLFGDAGVPGVALIGTSFSRNANFAPFLEHQLGEPVANVAKDGGNFAASGMAFFASAAFRDNPPNVLIWEVPERVIEMPLSQDERAWSAALAQGRLSR